MLICVFSQVRCICYKRTGSSPQHLGFRGYLEYYECCIFYFVIQLLSEPDKQNVAGLFRRQLVLCFCSVAPQLWYKCELSSAIVKAVLHHFHVLNFCTQSLQKFRTTSALKFCIDHSVNLICLSTKLNILKYFTPRKGFKLIRWQHNSRQGIKVQLFSEMKTSQKMKTLVEICISSNNNFA